MCGDRGIAPAEEVAGYTFFRCRQCEFAFTPQSPTELERFYERRREDTNPPSAGWAPYSFLEPALARLGAGPFQILDFGCGESVLPDQLRQRGHRVVGVDLAPPARPHPDRLTGDLLDLELAGDQFELSYSFQVFEHLPRPRAILERLLTLTRPGGVVLIHTDMETADRPRNLADWWYVQPPVHCSLYRHRTFEVVLRDRPHELSDWGPKHVLIKVNAVTSGAWEAA